MENSISLVDKLREYSNFKMLEAKYPNEVIIDNKGRIIIGKSPHRTCLDTKIGFDLDKMNKDGSCPCCGFYRHASVLWY